MEGVALRAQREMERDTALAWNIENMARHDQRRALPPLRRFLDRLKPKAAQTGAEILEVFREHQRRGANMSIRLVKPGEE